MAKFKKGDRVRIMTDSLTYLGVPKGCLGVVDQSDSTIPWVLWDESDGHGRWDESDGAPRWCTGEGNLELIGGTMNVGDILVDEDGDKKKVIAYLNQGVEVYLMSTTNDFEEVNTWYTTAELKKRGWKLQSDTEPIEKTVAELEEELGLEPGKLRIKKGE